MTPVTPDEFFTRFPQFSDADEDYVQALLNEAALQVDDSWVPEDQAPAVMYLTAHMLAQDMASAGSGGGGSGGGSTGGTGIATGPISSESFGPISVSYATGGGASASGSEASTADPMNLMSTLWGQRFASIRKRNKTGPVVV